MFVNVLDMLLCFVCVGVGIIVVGDYFVWDYVKWGDFVCVLLDWYLVFVVCWVVFLECKLMLLCIWVFLEVMVEVLKFCFKLVLVMF